MTFRHVSILLALLTAALALGWDAVVGIADSNRDTWCAAWREIGRASGGLIPLCLLALWVHVFLYQFLPSEWKP